MFWGLILEPYKRYTQTVQKSFHITNAALDVTTGDNDICQMMVGAQGKDFLICTLQKGKSVQTPLQLFFAEGSEISFTSSGKCVMHLTGFLEPEDFMGDEEEEEEDSESDMEESITVSSNKKDKKRKADSSLEENGSVKKSKNDQAANKKQKIQAGDDSSDDDDDSDADIAKLLQDDEESDENDDTYIPNETSEISAIVSEDDDDDEEDLEDEDDDEEDGDDSDDNSEAEETIQEVVPSEKKQKNKKDNKAQQNGFSEKKNKSNKENEQKTQQQKSEQTEKPSMEKKVLAGNVAVEDLKVGQGQVAKSGKMVQVYYEGKLKSNNKTFDSCQKGPGFKFKLGKKEVIPGWEIGLVGMRVGGKRRIVIPPGMAYGKKGSPPVIPPNSTLVFDVELKNIN